MNPKVLKQIPGAGKVYDFRGTGLCPPNGGRINCQIWVEHIPVIRNQAGPQDLITLGRVLKAQGLAVQLGTDAEGNVAIYTEPWELCYHARGANTVGGGTEHMHYGIGEPWTDLQFRAAAWCWQYTYRKCGVPIGMGKLTPGRPVGVKRKGHTSHRNVSAKAGYNDRSDPGNGFDWDRVASYADHYLEHQTFKGA